MTDQAKQYRLIGPDGRPYLSAAKGALGGNRRTRIYGQLDCPAARRAISRGGYISDRVFFATPDDAEAAGYRACGACRRAPYEAWKLNHEEGQ